MEFLSFPLFRRHRGEAQPSVRAVLDGERPIWFAHSSCYFQMQLYHFFNLQLLIELCHGFI